MQGRLRAGTSNAVIWVRRQSLRAGVPSEMLTPLWLLGQQTTRHEARELLFPHGSGGLWGLQRGGGRGMPFRLGRVMGGRHSAFTLLPQRPGGLQPPKSPSFWAGTRHGGDWENPVTRLVRCAGQTEDSHFLLGESAQSLLVWVVEATYPHHPCPKTVLLRQCDGSDAALEPRCWY